MSQRFFNRLAIALFLWLLAVGCTTQKRSIQAARDHVARGDACMAKRDFAQAKQHYLKASQNNPFNYRTWASAGLAAYYGGDSAVAVELFKKAIELNPNDYKVHGHLGLAYGVLGNYDEAVSAFKTALRLNDAALVSFVYLADLSFKQRRYAEWQEYMQEFETRLAKQDAGLLTEGMKASIARARLLFGSFRAVISQKQLEHTPQ